MKRIVFLAFTILSGVGFSVNAQTAYILKYNLQKVNDPTEYSAFFVNYEDGRAMVRVKYKSPVNGEMVRMQIDLQEQYSDSRSANTDTKTAFKPVNSRPVLPLAVNAPNFSTPVFWFKKNAGTELQEPWGVSMSVTDPDSVVNAFIPEIKIVDTLDLKNKDFVLQYFTENDEFYRSLFKIKTRALSKTQQGTRLILLAVGNIRDPKIGTSCAKDLNRIVLTFGSIASFLGIQFPPATVISGDNYNKQNVEKALNNLNPDTTRDIIVFYFSGHGFRKPGDNRNGPWIDLRPKDDDTYMVNSLHMESIYDIIKKKNARLSLVLADCCNKAVESSNAIGQAPTRKKGLILNWSQANCQALFLNPKRTAILACGAGPGQLSACNPEFGGFFSYFFKLSMENHFSNFKTDVTWDKVFKDVVSQTVYKAKWTWCNEEGTVKCDQTPFTRPVRIGN